MLVYHHRRWSQERLMESYKHHLVKFQPFGRCVNHRSKGHREDDREFKGVRAGGRGVGTLAPRPKIKSVGKRKVARLAIFGHGKSAGSEHTYHSCLLSSRHHVDDQNKGEQNRERRLLSIKVRTAPGRIRFHRCGEGRRCAGQTYQWYSIVCLFLLLSDYRTYTHW